MMKPVKMKRTAYAINGYQLMRKNFILVLATLVALATGSEASQYDTETRKAPASVMSSSERWKFEFDSREWVLGDEQAQGAQSIREYVLPGESVHAWSELVTSFSVGVDVSPDAWYRQQIKGMRKCRSSTKQLVDKSPNSVIFEGSHQGCDDFPPSAFIMRISSGRSGIQTLTFSQKGALSETNRRNWLAILRDAHIEDSLTLSELGPLPQNRSSKFLETTNTGFLLDPREDDEGNLESITGSLAIWLRATPGLPARAYLDVEFENPDDRDAPVSVGVIREKGQDEFLIVSPDFEHMRCWNYEVNVTVYRDKTKRRVLGVHRQLIQCRVNIDKLTSREDTLTATRQGRCP